MRKTLGILGFKVVKTAFLKKPEIPSFVFSCCLINSNERISLKLLNRA